MSTLKQQYEEKLKALADAAKLEGEEALEAWAKSQNAQRVLDLLKDLAEQKRKALDAEDESEDKVFYQDRVVKTRLKLAHAVEIEKLLVSSALEDSFFAVLDVGLDLVKDLGKEALATAVTAALRGVL